MPHVRIEYSGNLGAAFRARPFALRVHEHLVAIAAADLSNCKTRLIALGDVVIGDGSDANAMIHVDLRILPGRTEQQKHDLGAAVLRSLDDFLDKPCHLNVQLSVEVRDLSQHYRKVRL